MATPQPLPPPPKLNYTTHTYLTLSRPSPLPPHASHPELTYLGPLSSLPHEFLYSLPFPTTDPPSEEVRKVKEWLEGCEGVRGVEVMVARLREKR